MPRKRAAIPREQLVEAAQVHHTVRQYLVADATYGNGEFLQWLLDRGITPYMRTRDSARRKNNPGYGPERFTYLAREQ